MRNTLLRSGLAFGIVILLIGTNVVSSLNEISSKNNKNTNRDEIDQQQTDGGGGQLGITYQMGFAQSFIPQKNIISKVQLLMDRFTSCSGYLVVSIRNSLTENDLTSVTISGMDIPLSKNWVEFDFPDITINPGQTYYIVVLPSGFNSDDQLFWYFQFYNPYSNGKGWDYDFNTNEWRDLEQFNQIDFCFKTYYPGGGPVADFTWTPQTPTLGETVTFDASASYDHYGSIESYLWDFDNDGLFDDASGKIVTQSWSTIRKSIDPGTKGDTGHNWQVWDYDQYDDAHRYAYHNYDSSSNKIFLYLDRYPQSFAAEVWSQLGTSYTYNPSVSLTQPVTLKVVDNNGVEGISQKIIPFTSDSTFVDVTANCHYKGSAYSTKTAIGLMSGSMTFTVDIIIVYGSLVVKDKQLAQEYLDGQSDASYDKSCSGTIQLSWDHGMTYDIYLKAKIHTWNFPYMSVDVNWEFPFVHVGWDYTKAGANFWVDRVGPQSLKYLTGGGITFDSLILEFH